MKSTHIGSIALVAALLSSCASSSPGRKEFVILDSNHDGKVTSAEFSSHVTAEGFRLLDVDKNGRISPAEWGTRETSKVSAPLFQTLDANKDGFLEFQEFSASNKKKAHLDNTFQSLDRDGDGGLTWREVTR